MFPLSYVTSSRQVNHVNVYNKGVNNHKRVNEKLVRMNQVD